MYFIYIYFSRVHMIFCKTIQYSFLRFYTDYMYIMVISEYMVS